MKYKKILLFNIAVFVFNIMALGAAVAMQNSIGVFWGVFLSGIVIAMIKSDIDQQFRILKQSKNTNTYLNTSAQVIKIYEVKNIGDLRPNSNFHVDLLQGLEMKLQEAIQEEDYEEAALIREQIKRVRDSSDATEGKQSAGPSHE